MGLCVAQEAELHVAATGGELAGIEVLTAENLIHTFQAATLKTKGDGDTKELIWIGLEKVVEW